MLTRLDGCCSFSLSLRPSLSLSCCSLSPLPDLDLFHWVKIHNVPDYRFSKFAKTIKLLEYTSEEYAAYLEDPQWAKPETDRLMDLAKKFDLRFIIMEDRYNAMSDEAAARANTGALPVVDEARLTLALAHLHPTHMQHAGESKEEGDTKIKQEQQGAVTLADNVSMSRPSAPTAAGSSAPMETTIDGAPVVTPVVGDGVIVHSAPVKSESPSQASGGGSHQLGPPPPPGVFPSRSVEQLKSRFYFIQQTLTQLRNSSDPDLKKANPLFTHPYDAAHELLRKAQLERLYQRRAEEVDDMAVIVLEHRNVSNEIKKIKKAEKESRDLVRGYKSGARGTATAAGRAGIVGLPQPSGGAGASALKKKSASGGVKLPRGAPIVMGELAPIPSACDASVVLPHRPSGSVYLRSAQLADPLLANPRQQKHLEAELNQLNVKRLKDLPVPTGVVCDLWDKLRVNILTLLNLQQHVRDRETVRDDLRLHMTSSAAATGGQHAAATQPMSMQRQMSSSDHQMNSSMAPSQQYAAAGGPPANTQQNAAALAAQHQRKKQEKRRLEAETGQEQGGDDKRARTKK